MQKRSSAVFVVTLFCILVSQSLNPISAMLSSNNGGQIDKTLEEMKDGEITTVAGNFFFDSEGVSSTIKFEETGETSKAGEGKKATDISLNRPEHLALDGSGNLFFTDKYDRIFRMEAKTGKITLVAGTGIKIFKNISKPGIGYGNISSIAIDKEGNLLFAEEDNSIFLVKKFDTRTGVITIVAGNGKKEISDNDGPAKSIGLGTISSIAVDQAGNLFLAEIHRSGRIRRIDSATGIITTVVDKYSGWGLFYPSNIKFDKEGNLLISDHSWCGHILRLDILTKRITNIAGSCAFLGTDGIPAPEALISYPSAVAIDSAGNIFSAGLNRVQRYDVKNGIVTTVAGPTGSLGNWRTQFGFSRDGVIAKEANFDSITDMVVDKSGNIIIADSENNRIRRIDAATGILTTIAGNGIEKSSDNCPAKDAQLYRPCYVAVDAEGNIFISESVNKRIRMVDAGSGIIKTLIDFHGINNSHASSILKNRDDFSIIDNLKETDDPSLTACNIAAYDNGHLLISDSANHRILRLNLSYLKINNYKFPANFSIREAGNKKAGFSGDGGPAILAGLDFPTGIVVDSLGTLFIADTNNHSIRRVDEISYGSHSTTGVISTIAKIEANVSKVESGLTEKPGPVLSYNLTVDSKGNLFIADRNNHRILRIDSVNGRVSTIAGTGKASFSGDGGPAILAGLNFPTGIAADAAGNLFIADTNNNRIRMVKALTGQITTVVGSGPVSPQNGGFDGDGGPAINARLNFPQGVAIDKKGNLLIADTENNIVRIVKGIAKRQ